MSWQLALSGLLIGALVGTTGMGGGSLMTPLLVIAFGFQPAVAVRYGPRARGATGSSSSRWGSRSEPAT